MNPQEMAFKFRSLVFPLILLSVAFSLGYSFLNWLLVARTSWIPIDEDVVNLWLPGALAWIFVIVMIQPRIRVLKIRDKRGNLPFLYHLAAVAVVATPAMIAQGYVKTATGVVTHVNDADQIAAAPRTKFYTADHICMHLNAPISHAFSSTSGKNNETLVTDMYVMSPICSTTKGDEIHKEVWLGIKYSHSMSNSAAIEEKQSEFVTFSTQSLRAFNAEDPLRYQFLETAGHNSDTKRFEKTLALAGYEASTPVILVPHLEAFDQRTGGRLMWFAIALAAGPLIWIVMIMIPAIDRATTKPSMELSDPITAQTNADMRGLIIPSRDSFGLPILIDANILVFIAMAISGLGVISFDSDGLLAWGANYRPAIYGWGMLRLLSSQFVHSGLMHLLNNLYGLLFAAIFLGPVAKNGSLIGCYLFCGLCGSIASVTVHPATVSVGASGAIFGLFGILLMLVLLGDARLAVVRKVLFVNAGIFVALNLFIGATSRGIDNAAHLGGLLGGAVLGVGLTLFNRYIGNPPAAGRISIEGRAKT